MIHYLLIPTPVTAAALGCIGCLEATVALAPNGHFAQELPLPWLRPGAEFEGPKTATSLEWWWKMVIWRYNSNAQLFRWIISSYGPMNFSFVGWKTYPDWWWWWWCSCLLCLLWVRLCYFMMISMDSGEMMTTSSRDVTRMMGLGLG